MSIDLDRVPEAIRELFLSGQMTLGEFEKAQSLTLEKTRACMERRHGKCHAALIARFPEIATPAASYDALAEEVAKMPMAIQVAFLAERLTLIQARYAARRGLTIKALAKFVEAINKPHAAHVAARKARKEAVARRQVLARLRPLDRLTAMAFDEYSSSPDGIQRYLAALANRTFVVTDR